mmetsp:Transcript_1959/g.4396  ORF Transcript_1959/g.4396 Transcript_1959/m.4396 type:complete len:219 (+) Transcript_1959:1489-2145(+)
MTRSMAALKSSRPTASLLCRAAMRAPSFTTLAISAPENPGESDASFCATSSMSSARRIFGRWTRKISARPLMSGAPMSIDRSKRPGRSSAESSVSGRLVPAMITMFPVVEKPSISTSNWFRVFSRSSFPPAMPPFPRALPMASISSIQTMQGCIDFAWAKRSRTLAGPTPTNISMKSEPDTERNGTFASPAVALASSVLPVPGGPVRSAPLGILAPNF